MEYKYQTIKRKDGVTYTRRAKVKNSDCFLNIRYSKDKTKRLKKIAEVKNV